MTDKQSAVRTVSKNLNNSDIFNSNTNNKHNSKLVSYTEECNI